MTFSSEVPPGLVPYNLGLPSLLSKCRITGLSPDPYVSQGQRLQHQEGTWGFLIKVSGNSADHAYYMQCAPVKDSAHDAGYGTIT